MPWPIFKKNMVHPEIAYLSVRFWKNNRFRPEGPAVRSAQGNALGKGTPAIFLLCDRPNGPKIRLTASRTVGPLGRKKSSFSPSPGRCPGLGERLGLRPDRRQY